MSTQRDSAAGDGSNDEGSEDPLCESMTRTHAEAVKESKRLKEKAAEFEVDAQRLRAAGRKLLEEADEMDERSRKLKEEAKASEDLGVSMHFDEATLRRLKRNDSSLVTVDTREYPKGYGKALGAALLENTVVETLELVFDTFLSENQDEKEFEPIIKFLATSTSLTELGTYRCLKIATPNLANSILIALSENKRLEILVWNLRAPPISFCNLLREVQSLTRLCVAFKGADNFSDAEKQMVASAIGDSRLECLKLPSPLFSDLTSLILANLHRLQSFTELMFWQSGSSDVQHPFDAMSQYLGTTQSLGYLELKGFSLEDSCMERILSGLVQLASSTGVPSTSLSQLAFPECTMDNDATERLAAFLQTKTTDSDGGNIVYHSSLDYLRIDTTSNARSCKMLVDSLLMSSTPSSDVNQKPKLLPTVGSQIAFLSMANVRPVFLDLLRRNSHRVGLKSLRLFRVSKPSSLALCKCLRQLVSLENLYIHGTENGSAPWIVRGLKRNASVCRVVVDDEHDFDVTHVRLMKAYCDRNTSLGRMIATEPSRSDSSNDDGEDSGASSTTTGPKDTLGLRTSLLQTAHAIPKKRSAMFMQGLLTLGQRCGYGQDQDHAVSDNLE